MINLFNQIQIMSSLKCNKNSYASQIKVVSFSCFAKKVKTEFNDEKIIHKCKTNEQIETNKQCKSMFQNFAKSLTKFKKKHGDMI